MQSRTPSPAARIQASSHRQFARQSSTYPHSTSTSTADLAVDGNKNPVFNCKSCMSTDSLIHKWWSVDLNAPYTVTFVRLTNRLSKSIQCNVMAARSKAFENSGIWKYTVYRLQKLLTSIYRTIMTCYKPGHKYCS